MRGSLRTTFDFQVRWIKINEIIFLLLDSERTEKRIRSFRTWWSERTWLPEKKKGGRGKVESKFSTQFSDWLRKGWFWQASVSLLPLPPSFPFPVFVFPSFLLSFSSLGSGPFRAVCLREDSSKLQFKGDSFLRSESMEEKKFRQLESMNLDFLFRFRASNYLGVY